MTPTYKIIITLEKNNPTIEYFTKVREDTNWISIVPESVKDKVAIKKILHRVKFTKK
jgi:hypothetical protein